MRRTTSAVEDLVLKTRQDLRASDLGAIGADSIRQVLVDHGVVSVPSVRTINRILGRCGAHQARRRMCRTRPPAPSRGWYLPDVAMARRELDSFDIVERLATRDAGCVQVLNGVSLHGGLTASWLVAGPVTARFALASLTQHWRAVGLPASAQFDNDPVFQGTHNSAVALSRVVRLCLSLGVAAVFVPPGEVGFQAMIEGYNAWWRAKVWAPTAPPGIAEAQSRSQRYVAATRRHRARRIEGAPARRPFPEQWCLDLQARPCGRIVYLRRTNKEGELAVFGQKWRLPVTWPRRLVRIELDLTGDQIAFFTICRTAPLCQPLVLEADFRLPVRRFQG